MKFTQVQSTLNLSESLMKALSLLLAIALGSIGFSPIAIAQDAGTTEEKPAAAAASDKPAKNADKPAKKADKPAEASDKPAKKSDKPAKKADKPATPKADVGQADLDAAVIKRIDADSAEQLESVSSLLKSALAKGLSDENRVFAKQMLGSVLLQRSQELASGIMKARGRQKLQMKTEALDSLNQAIEYDPSLVEAYLLIARLNMLPDGDIDAIKRATTKAIELLGDEPGEQSAAYVLRALTQPNDKDKLADLDQAVKVDPSNLEAMQARAVMRLQTGDVDGAIADLESLLAKDPTNEAIAKAAVDQLIQLSRVDDAINLVTKTLQAKPNEGMYRLRGILYQHEGRDDEALADFNKALAMQPKDPLSLLLRSQTSLARGDVKAAKRDYKSAIDIAPQVADADQAIFLRCLIAVEEKRMTDAINDMKLLVSRDPENITHQLRLANLYSQDNRPRLAIDTLTAILDREPKNAIILRSRADAWLSVGDHAKAIKDYETALTAEKKDDLDNSGLLNNLAWVLATSPQEGIRDGKRALELGERAAKATDYKEAHILSTLAAAYAETGDFAKAIQWSTKAVELAEVAVKNGKTPEETQVDQLKEELESYKKNEPWREKQQVEENKVPILAPEDLIDT